MFRAMAVLRVGEVETSVVRAVMAVMEVAVLVEEEVDCPCEEPRRRVGRVMIVRRLRGLVLEGRVVQ